MSSSRHTRRAPPLALVLALWGIGIGPVGAAPDRAPHIGYLYPAGGSQGTVTRIAIGGQYLQGVTRVHVSGYGVQAEVIDYVKPLTRKQEGEVRRTLGYLRRRQQAVRAGNAPPAPPDNLPELPDHPWLEGMDAMDVSDLQHLNAKLFNPKKQPNPQLAELVNVELTIAPDAAPGNREVHVETALGLTNPMRLQVGRMPERDEPEPGAPDAPITVQAPVVLNGRILPGDVDRYAFHAPAGQVLRFDARARRLIPYLADAVPGWFQAILTLYDADGRKVACADDYRFHPDPLLVVEIPTDGDYVLEIRDAIFRGRADFVYRIAVTESVLEADRSASGTEPDLGARREREPNDTAGQAESIDLPQRVTGRIDPAGDMDLYRFTGKADQMIVAEAFARRRLHSPLDTLIKLLDESGNTVAWNDDHMPKDGHLHLGPGLLTHHADSYLQAQLPGDGTYVLRMEDAQQHGGTDYAYHLRIGPPQPDVALRVTPSSLTFPAGRTLPIEIRALRRDGFDGPIQVALVDPPPGFALSGARIPAGVNHIRMTLTAPPTPLDEPVALRLQGQARIGNREVLRAVVPVDNTMQAFLWRHLVPAHELLVLVRERKGWAGSFSRADPEPVRIAAGGTADIRVQVPNRPVLKNVRWALIDPPPGLSLGKTRIQDGTLVLGLRASAQGLEDATLGNLIIGATLDRPAGKGKRKPRPASLGVLPAIPVEILKTKG